MTPIGNDAPSTWRAAVEGRSGIDFMSEWGDIAYDAIRADPQLDKVAATAAEHGFSVADIQQIFKHVFVDEHEIRASVAEDPSAFEELWWGKRLSGARINLRAADPQRVFELLEEAWRRRASRRLVAAFDAGPGVTALGGVKVLPGWLSGDASGQTTD